MTTKDLCNETWRSLTGAQQEAVVRKLWLAGKGEANTFKAILDGDLGIELKDATRKLLDHTGRGIPFAGMQGKVVDANREYYLTQPVIKYGDVLARLKEYFRGSAKFPSESEFAERGEAALARIRADRQVGNLLAGPHFVGCLPQMDVGDLGTLIDNELIPTFARSYNSQFPTRTFNNYRKGELAGQVTVVPGTRHERLIEALRQGPVIYVYAPALQGFSIPADREFVTVLPEWVLLSGIDVLGVGIAYPEVIGRDWKTPGLDLAALQWRSVHSLYCKACDDEFSFGVRRLDAYDGCAGGLVVLG